MRCETFTAALLGLAAVVLGSLGAHGPLADRIGEVGRPENWETASRYHLVHAAVLLAWSLRPFAAGRAAFWIAALGLTLFSGALYVLAATGWEAASKLAPAGGVLLILGWIAFALAALRPSQTREN